MKSKDESWKNEYIHVGGFNDEDIEVRIRLQLRDIETVGVQLRHVPVRYIGVGVKRRWTNLLDDDTLPRLASPCHRFYSDRDKFLFSLIPSSIIQSPFFSLLLLLLHPHSTQQPAATKGHQGVKGVSGHFQHSNPLHGCITIADKKLKANSRPAVPACTSTPQSPSQSPPTRTHPFSSSSDHLSSSSSSTSFFYHLQSPFFSPVN